MNRSGLSATQALTSRFYTGTLRHRRYYPVPHAFTYKVFMSWLNLDELELLPFTREGSRWRWAQFRRSDYLAPASLPLKQAVLNEVERQTGTRPQGEIFLLTNLRYGGICFNPISLYYCFDPKGQLQAVLGDVSNMPWLERTPYVALCETDQSRHQASFDKRMHVSPFNPMQQQYLWKFTTPGEQLVMHMDNIDPDGRVPFDSTLVLQRRDDLGLSMLRMLLRHPWMTLKAVAGIHFEALRLWLKKNPVYAHPAKMAKR
ncbi:DUF1365 domain-containing protein [Marinospirillum alkaliphilum]|uniref:DUF1365 domain-containing protein n=1 Tax=Marinospirillum alkaliphilum DSM 21637 TaxID=1122209 RepID=A0A1K1WUH8_9GAMM|nr:DUF1365 domain-containing protein [Marinospirillum alkaliphilum]SFX40787.1 hypothetical protein SAMN02745752_01573 [Marinospirillum alkaliphilum DSM 21637]